jgi:penicillin amidase
VPYEHNPFLYNPTRGYIDSANNKIIDDEEYPYYIGSRSSPYRAELIRDHMKGKEKFSIDDFKRMHSDVLAAPPRHLLPTAVPVLQRISLSDGARQALATVKAWDHRFDAESTGASIYDRFVTVLIRNTFKDEVGDELFQRFFTGIGMEEIVKTQSAWFDDVTTPAKETRDTIIRKSFEESVAELKGQLGPDQSQWQWKKINVVWINHRTPLSNDPVQGKRLNLGPFPQDGKRGWTINPVNADIYEQIVDLSNIDNSIAMMPPGNSERVDSPNYRDQVDLWIRGDYHPSFLSRTLVEAAAIEHTVFQAK